MTVFQSQLEDLMPAEELLFDCTPGFGRYRPYMKQALSHPAKMNVRLLEFLVKSHTKEGDVVLDPMAGSGSTGVISALNGRNAVCVELEEKFFGWMEEARKKVEGYSNLSDKGKLINIKGDARQLSNLVQKTDFVITSPPYGEAQQGQGIAKYGYQGDKHSSTDLVGKRSYMPDKFESKDNISCLSMGDIDAVITSPPYAEVVHSTGQTREKVIEMLRKKGYGEAWIQAHYMGPYCQVKETGYSENPENIGNLSNGDIDAIITSHPYEESLGSKHHSPRADKIAMEKSLNTTYTEKDGIDAVITSPPYEQTVSHKHGGRDPYPELSGGSAKISEGYSSDDKNNIGNLKKETYLEAMLKVYAEMCKVLKPGGSAIIIIKPFIRNKKVVDLPWHTWLLLEKVGFKLSKVYKLRLKQDSFWRILYKQKYPDVPHIKHEYVLVCQKPQSFYA